MDAIDWSNPWLIASGGLLVGLLLGIVVMTLVQRRGAGGKSVTALRREFEAYKDGVNQHFATTAELFKDMTEKYRDVYTHLANGAEELCETRPAVLEAIRRERIGHEPASATNGATPPDGAKGETVKKDSVEEGAPAS